MRRVAVVTACALALVTGLGRAESRESLDYADQSGAGPFRERYCGAGDLAACRASLWRALDEAAAALEAAQGADPAAWRADAARERITYGFLPASMRFANRPTFQQVVSFRGHRPR